MQFYVAALLLPLTSMALTISTKAPSKFTLTTRDTAVCPSLDTPLCCQLDVEGVVDTPCETPSKAPKSVKGFEKICAETGYTAMCCTLPVGGDGLLCSAP